MVHALKMATIEPSSSSSAPAARAGARRRSGRAHAGGSEQKSSLRKGLLDAVAVQVADIVIYSASDHRVNRPLDFLVGAVFAAASALRCPGRCYCRTEVRVYAASATLAAAAPTSCKSASSSTIIASSSSELLLEAVLSALSSSLATNQSSSHSSAKPSSCSRCRWLETSCQAWTNSLLSQQFSCSPRSA